VIVADPGNAIVPRLQVKLGPAAQAPCDGVTVPWVNPVGHVSVTSVFGAGLGPLLVTVIVYEPACVPGAFAVYVVTPSVFAIARSVATIAVWVSAMF